MRIAIIGAGPAGLYLAYLLKRARPNWVIDIHEQNAADVTFGFGVAFSRAALDFLGHEDPEILAAMVPSLETWNDSILDLNGTRIDIDGMDYAGIGRLRLIELLAGRAQAVGVIPRYGQRVTSLPEKADLIVGADGANSIVRNVRTKEFGATETLLHNRFAWFGTRKRFDALTHTFIETPEGVFNAHHHPHTPDMSTFVVEMDEATFLRNGFDKKPEDMARSEMEYIFSATLQGAPLLSNRSIWRRFPKIRCTRWSAANCVLLGDALHTVHFSIGSGTRLALEDAGALGTALLETTGIPQALATYEARRKPLVEKFLSAADASAAWYETFAEKMRLPPLDFAMSYVMRSGRMTRERLQQSSPQFLARYEAHASTRRPPP